MATLSISEVKISNMALSHIGAKSAIESMTEDSTEANACDLWYTFARRMTLASYDWSFARRRLTLADHGDDPPSGVWSYRYQYPSDCIVMRKLENPSGLAAIAFYDGNKNYEPDAVPFDIETDDDQDTKSILTNLDDAVGVYTFDLTTVTMFSEYFVMMLSYAIGSLIAYTVTGQTDMKDRMEENFRNMAVAASASDANERVDAPPRDADYIRGR